MAVTDPRAANPRRMGSEGGCTVQFRVGDKVREGMHVGTVTDVGTVLIQVKTTMGASRMVCPWELVRLPASCDGHISNSATEVKPREAIIAVQNVEETDLAWALIDAARHRLNTHERNVVFVAVGAGDTFATIRTLLKLIAAKRIPLPPDLVQLCATWLDAYALRAETRVPSQSDRKHLGAGYHPGLDSDQPTFCETSTWRADHAYSQFRTRRVPVERPKACRAAWR